MKLLTEKQIEEIKEQSRQEILKKIKKEFINAETSDSFCEFIFNFLFK